MAAEAALEELAVLLGPSAGAAVRAGAAEAALALSGDPEGRRLLAARPEALRALLGVAEASGPELGPAPGAALRCLQNVSAEPEAREPLLAALPAVLRLLPAGPACGLLANLSRERGAARRVFGGLERESGAGAEALLRALEGPRPPPELGALLCNLSGLPEGRRALLERPRCAVRRLLPLVGDAESAVLRRGAVGALRNCCFQHEHHEWLLSDEVDLLPSLLLPLAGPEEFPEDEMERLPVELQYLPEDKEREPEPDIRRMLLEALLLLTATKAGRLLLREKGTYVVLRELHRCEKDPEVLSACEKLIQVLIGDEPEPGMENLLEVNIPAEVEERLRSWDREEEERRQREEAR
ncbi:protein HGH1 homolog [Phasianus colchicus]|uniref:Protein HGH1 homolog n=1 Tax=Phasianus colchicus TaxID=9054 RepID=A0A669QE50_PHACC|nr:protein HGH1 homolog [Phasianus colchicus]